MFVPSEGMTTEEAEMVTSYWPFVQRELELRIQAVYNAFRTCPKDELPRLQERIAVLEEIKRLPNDVLERRSF